MHANDLLAQVIASLDNDVPETVGFEVAEGGGGVVVAGGEVPCLAPEGLVAGAEEVYLPLVVHLHLNHLLLHVVLRLPPLATGPLGPVELTPAHGRPALLAGFGGDIYRIELLEIFRGFDLVLAEVDPSALVEQPLAHPAKPASAFLGASP